MGAQDWSRYQLPICLLVFFSLFAFEAVLPKRKLRDRRSDRLLFHGSLFLFNSTLFTLLISRVQVLWILFVNDLEVGVISGLKLPTAATFLLSLILLDLTGYGIHRLLHAIPFLWRFHSVHHSDTELDVTTGFRSHFLQAVFAALFESVAIVFIGPTLSAFLVYTIVLFCMVHFHHSNIRLPNTLERLLGLVFVTPSMHSVHHQTSLFSQNSNFAAIFKFWDVIFKTQHTAIAGETAFGIGKVRGSTLTFSEVFTKPVFGKVALVFSLATCIGCTKVELEPVSKQLQIEIDYGRELIAHTAKYLGPKGTVQQNTKTRMNCQNCHLDAGTKPYGISFETTFTRYPEYRAREGRIITIEDRINNCFERPMNGSPLTHQSREMKAIVSYFRYLSRGKVVGAKKRGENLNDVVALLDRAADPVRGKHVFDTRCASCHGGDGQGQLNEAQTEFIYPPLWGPESFNAASNMHRLIKSAAFIKANMPLGATVDKPLLTNEEAFDVASFINSQSHSRPKSKWKDYVTISEKPIDYPHGPYADGMTQEQHRLGPFKPIMHKLKELNIAAFY